MAIAEEHMDTFKMIVTAVQANQPFAIVKGKHKDGKDAVILSILDTVDGRVRSYPVAIMLTEAEWMEITPPDGAQMKVELPDGAETH